MTGCDAAAVTGATQDEKSNPEHFSISLQNSKHSASIDSLLIDLGGFDMSSEEDTLGQDPPGGGS